MGQGSRAARERVSNPRIAGLLAAAPLGLVRGPALIPMLGGGYCLNNTVEAAKPASPGLQQPARRRDLWAFIKLCQEGPQRLLLEFEFGQAWLMQLAALLNTAQVLINILGTTEAHFSHRLKGLEALRQRAWARLVSIQSRQCRSRFPGAARGKRNH